MSNSYKILGVNENDSEETIKRAYHNKAKQMHPDKGGDPEKFKELNDAYDKIVNGKANEQNGRSHFHDMFSGMGSNMFFHAMNGSRQGNHIYKQTVELRINLEDIYKPKSFNINGSSFTIPENFPLYTQYDLNENMNVILKHNKHTLFNVENNGNIRINQQISLYEALLGFAIRFKHPNGKSMFVSKKGVIKQDECIVYHKMGIPCLKKNHVTNLEIVFKIDMPQTIENIEEYEESLSKMLKFNIPKITPNDNDVIL